jgi:enoyl-[acyl-carrier protein] reductase I
VASDEDVASFFRAVADHYGGELDVLVHSIGHARADELTGSYLNISRDGYAFAHSISAFSLVACAREAAPLLEAGGSGSVLTITYAASTRVMPDYNVMASAKAALECHVRYLAAELGPRNVRVNAIAAGPIRTLSANAVKSLAAGRRQMEERAPLRRNVDTDEVGDVALFLASDLSRCVTGEIINADNGFHVLGA